MSVSLLLIVATHSLPTRRLIESSFYPFRRRRKMKKAKMGTTLRVHKETLTRNQALNPTGGMEMTAILRHRRSPRSQSVLARPGRRSRLAVTISLVLAQLSSRVPVLWLLDLPMVKLQTHVYLSCVVCWTYNASYQRKSSMGSGSKPPPKKRAKKDKNAPKGASSAFIQFSQAKRAEVSHSSRYS